MGWGGPKNFPRAGRPLWRKYAKGAPGKTGAVTGVLMKVSTEKVPRLNKQKTHGGKKGG